MKRIQKILLACLCAVALCLTIAACAKPRLNHEAEPEEPDVVLTKITVGDITYQDLGDQLHVYAYLGEGAALTVPATVEIVREAGKETLPVTGLASYALADCGSLVSVTLPSSV